MALQLSPGEKLIRSWNYAGDDTSSGRNDDVLIVTDKRLVATSSSPDSLTRTEIPLKIIKSISSSYSSKRTIKSEPKGALLVIGIISILAGIVLMAFSSTQGTSFLAFGIILSILGIILIIVGATKKTTVLSSADFSLIITTYGEEGTPLTVGKKAGATQSQTVVINSITINEKVIMDIIDTLGAIAINKMPPAKVKTETKKSPLIDDAKIVPIQTKEEPVQNNEVQN